MLLKITALIALVVCGYLFIAVPTAIAPHDASDPDILLKYADMALYAAKTDGRRTFRFFQTEMNARLHARRALFPAHGEGLREAAARFNEAR